MRIYGHRGASADRPENTLEAFLEAGRQGADGVELDVIRCGSGELVVCHDEHLDRLAGVSWDVRTTSWRRLQTLEVGTRLGFAPAKLPLLADVFAALPASLRINVELKCLTVDDHGLTDAVVDCIERAGMEGRVFLSSFNPWCLVRLARRAPTLRRGLLLDPEHAWLPQAWGWLPITSSTSVHPHHTACTSERVNRWHAVGWNVVAWTVDDVDDARKLRAMGVDAIITNRPGALRAELARSVA
jgi:glycerophosphoryl diester phosphodiesterase